MKKIAAFFAAALLVCGCGIYSFTGTSIQDDVKTVQIDFFEYRAEKVNPSLSNDFTEAFKTRFRRMTRLEQVDVDGDLQLSGTVTNYEVSATSFTANDVAAQNRLTISISMKFTNRKHPEDDFERTFSAYSDYDSSTSLDSVESTLCAEIIDKIVEDVFNASVAQW